MSRNLAVEYSPRRGGFGDTHEQITRTGIAQRLAALMGLDYAGEYDPAARYAGRVYFVPSDTIIGSAQAARLGITGEHDLFGGVVPSPVVATKAITHPLVDPDARAPQGWSEEFPERVQNAVLAGYSVFTPEQARIAGYRLLEHGTVRLKPVHATAGRGQRAIRTRSELDEALIALNSAGWNHGGLVVEENLTDVTTYSIGQVRLPGLTASYYGNQRLTRDNVGDAVYGGSDLVVVRGGFDALARRPLPDNVRIALEQARAYDAATTAFPGLFASRRNYDIAQGVNSTGQWRSGVLEQSWRIGGATGAEIAALEAFRADPRLSSVRASTFEIYGTREPPPQGAILYFDGVDERNGRMTKYVVMEPHGDSR